ncbi:TetR/AcrR family transcriptional regulator [Nocardia goodfellowii]|uniref:AcrR family transcriptional regulator n=1 Tax=Nocardia goodfellowii TaxID=882446 RepID=A0ABS4QFP4_9NOCA|nr:TetR/AcrR family transcriptional regulator [Nocardia goodfellowii]MBP2190497.1 AcrR family transcriptional regulator [Nocardia goodfellowii]
MRRDQSRQRNRESLMDAAVAEIAAKGYQAARLEDIAARADLTTGAIYSIFGSKRGLLLAASRRLLDGQVEALAALSDPELSLTEVLDGLAGYAHRMATAELRGMQMAFQLEAMAVAFREPELMATITQSQDITDAMTDLLTGRRIDTSGATTTPEQAQRLQPAVEGLITGLAQLVALGITEVSAEYFTESMRALIALIV